MKTLTWLADSRTNVRSFPPNIRDGIGYALYLAQMGEMSATSKPLHGFGGGVMETAVNDASGAYRTVPGLRPRGLRSNSSASGSNSYEWR